MTSSKQRRLSKIFTTSPPHSEENVPEVPDLPKSAGYPVTPTADSPSSDPFRMLSQAQKRLRTLSTFFQGHSTKSTEDISQQPPQRTAPSPSTNISEGKLHKANSPPRATREQDASPKSISSPKVRGRQSLMPPPPFDGSGNPRSVSSPAPTQRPATSHQRHTSGSSAFAQGSPLRELESKLHKNRWGKSRKSAIDVQPNQPRAWVMAGQEKIAYNFELLEKAQKVPELWNEGGDTFVYLYPRTANQGPSFKISSMVLADSRPLIQLSHSGQTFRNSSFSMQDAARNMDISGGETPPHTPKVNPLDNQTVSDGSEESMRSFDSGPRDNELYFPIALSTDSAIDQENAKLTDDDIETLITARNLFAFLTGQPLVATSIHPTLFSVFLGISQLLKRHEFSNMDGSTFGEAVSLSFSFYIDELRLADVRHSREKTIEAIILGERMRSTELYDEAFPHAVGKYDSIKSMESPLFSMISTNSQQRLERASMELYQRQKAVGIRLEDFDFPSLWSGVAGSTSSIESKVIRFKLWKQAFLEMRKFVMSYYKTQFGSWPPKASSKKNNFVESGLNRLVLMNLYEDFSGIYDLLVDRTSLTSRTLDSDAPASTTADDPLIITHTLRRLLSEFDKSSPPVQPPVPFDIPNIPSRMAIDERHIDMPLQDQIKANNKKLKDHESMLLLAKSHNVDAGTMANKRPFIEAFKAFEAKAARHCNTIDIADQRYGHWIFMYVILQSLPLLVVDAPGVRFNEGVEYFLCAPPRGGLPWMEQQEKRAWFGVAGGAGMVELPKDVVEYGVVATYQRSHCWIMAEQWGPEISNPADEERGNNPDFDFGLHDTPVQDLDMPNFDNEEPPPFSPLLPPPGFARNISRPGSSGSDMSRRSRSGSPSARMSVFSGNSRPRSSFYGLEPLPYRPASSHHDRSRSGNWTPDLQPPPGLGNLAEARGSRQSVVGEKSGMSFDDILGDIESSKKKKDKKKK